MPAGKELAAWLRLLLSPGIGRDTARALLAAHGGPEAVFDAPAELLREQLGRLASAVLREPDGLSEHVARSEAWLKGGPQRAVVALGEAHYPPLLLQTADPPLLLFLEGRAELLSRPSIAIVGSRSATAQGLDNARRMAAECSRRGYTVVSGLAAGIDGAAHEGGLAADGSTVAVVGTGLDRVYPASHHALAQRIAAQGLLLSEFPLGTPPLAQNFPMRNRIIAGLSLGTLVVEAALRSGSLITARLAGEMGREVFAMPGSIHAQQARGCHALIKQGAKLVESIDDVLEEFTGHTPPVSPARPDPPDEAAPPAPDPLLHALGHDPVTLDTLVARTGWSAAELNVRLLELELDQQVSRLPGGLFQRLAHG